MMIETSGGFVIADGKFSGTTPVVGTVERANHLRRNSADHRARRNHARHDRARADHRVVANRDASENRRAMSDPDIEADADWRGPNQLAGLERMKVGVVDRDEISDQTTLADLD